MILENDLNKYCTLWLLFYMLMQTLQDKNMQPKREFKYMYLYLLCKYLIYTFRDEPQMVKLQARIYPTIHKDLSSRSLNCDQQFVELSVQPRPLLGQVQAKIYFLYVRLQEILGSKIYLAKTVCNQKKKALILTFEYNFRYNLLKYLYEIQHIL